MDLRTGERVIAARFDGVCIHCGNEIQTGERIVYDAIARRTRHTDCTVTNHRAEGDGIHPMYKPTNDGAIFARILGGH